MRDPNSKNPNQNSIYVPRGTWEAARVAAKAKGMSRSRWIVALIEKELKKVGKENR